MMTQNEIEEAKLNAMQRAWQSKRGIFSIFEESVPVEEQLFASPNQLTLLGKEQKQLCLESPSSSKICKDESDVSAAWNIFQEQLLLKPYEVVEKKVLTLNASDIDDFPACYTICSLESHQLPVIGVYVDKRIISGFKYRIRPLPQIGQKSTTNKCFFNDRPLLLKSIGRGYSRRFTFEADPNHLNNNENYFWSDNRPEGYAFELEAMSEGDKFTIFDMNNEAQGTLEVLRIERPQFEISNVFIGQDVQKRVNVKFIGKVEFYETRVAKPMPLSGVVIIMKAKNKNRAEIGKVLNVIIQRQRYNLIPGISKSHRRVTVRGQDINDVPTKYSMTGLEPHELPVVGTYVDSRVIPGFYYKVRPNDRKDHLFGGRELKLVSIGIGYAKKLTFEPDSMLRQDNYLWSDNHPDGLGLEIRAVRKNMKFNVRAGVEVLGEATVWRADVPQTEEKMERIKTKNGYALEKYIHIDVMCHVQIAINGLIYAENEEYHMMRVCGTAVVRKEPHGQDVRVLKIENIGLDSQLNLLFAQNQVELKFYLK